MIIDPENKIIILCAEGMKKEGEGLHEEAARLFQFAWEKASNDFEKFIAAHYVARHQNSIEDKLKWDIISPVLCDGTPKLNFQLKKVNNFFLL